MLNTIKDEIGKARLLDKKVVIIFISVAVLQTLSWYFASRQFFRANFLYDYFLDDVNAELYESLYWFLSDFVILLLIPIVIIKAVFKERLNTFGIQLGDYKTGFTGVLIFAVLFIPAAWFLTASEQFSSAHPYLGSAKYSWNIFVIYQLGFLIYMFAWEFIWRGYMLLGLEPKFGYYSVFIQMLPFVILHNGKPFVETLASIAGAWILGVFVFRTRSVLYPALIHFTLMFSMDLFSTLRYRAQEYGAGIESFINLFR